MCVYPCVCVCAHPCMCLCAFELYSKIRIQYKIDDSSLSEKPYFLEAWLVSHLLTEHKGKGNYKKKITLLNIKIE